MFDGNYDIRRGSVKAPASGFLRKHGYDGVRGEARWK
jgi:hypothetical protein